MSFYLRDTISRIWLIDTDSIGELTTSLVTQGNPITVIITDPNGIAWQIGLNSLGEFTTTEIESMGYPSLFIINGGYVLTINIFGELITSRYSSISFSTSSLNFTSRRSTGNPRPQNVYVNSNFVQGASIFGNLVGWEIRNPFDTSWLKISDTEGFGNGFFSVSVNIYDSSTVLGTQTSMIFVEYLGFIFPISVTLTIQPN